MNKEILKDSEILNNLLYEASNPIAYKHRLKSRERFNLKYGMYWRFISLNNYYKLLRPPIIL